MSGRFELETERLFLRPLVEDDKDVLRQTIFTEPDCLRTLMGDGSTLEKQKHLVDEWYDDYATTWEEHGYGLWGIFGHKDQPDLPHGLIGIIWFEADEDEGSMLSEIGYALAPVAWGQGLVTEAGRAVCAHAFERTKTLAVVANIFPKINPGSVRVIEKLGGTYQKQKPARDYMGDEWMGYTRDYDLWLIENSASEHISSRIHDACFRIGQFAAEDFASVQDSRRAIGAALERNPQLTVTQELNEMVSQAFDLGFANPGWSQYRIEKEAFEAKENTASD